MDNSFDQLPLHEQDAYLVKARYLISNGYFTLYDDEYLLAKEIFEKEKNQKV